MGLLKDLLSRKQTIVEEDGHTEQEEQLVLYNNAWLRRTSNRYGYIISSDEKKVAGILGALERKDGHCPCGGNGDQFICPCINMRERGLCKCGLYENIIPVNPSGTSTGGIKRNDKI